MAPLAMNITLIPINAAETAKYIAGSDIISSIYSYKTFAILYCKTVVKTFLSA